MKIRAGFVSNSSSSCFICGIWIREDEHICKKCFENNVIKDFLSTMKPYLDITDEEANEIYEKYIRRENENED